MRKASSNKSREVRALKSQKNSDIDLSDIPEIKDWREAVVGKFYRPIKKPLTIRLDADVIAWLKSNGRGYQTRINGILRKAMENRAR